MNRMHQVGTFLQQATALRQGFTDQPDLRVFQVAQAAVNNSRGPTSGTRGEVLLLDQKCAASGAGALARDGHAVDSTTDDNHLEVFAFQWPADWENLLHV